MASPTGRPSVFRRQDNWIARYGCLAFLVLFVGFWSLCSGLMGVSMLVMDPVVFLFAGTLALMTTVPYGALLLWLDRNEKEPWWLIFTAFFWGAAVSTAISALFNDLFGGMAAGMVGDAMLADQLTASISAPFIEELTKGLAVWFIFLLFKRDFDNALDGLLYGALVGLGFAWFENIMYYVNAAAGGGMGNMVALAWARGVLSGIGSHATFTGLTGLGFGLVRVLRKGFLRWLLVPLFWGGAMFAHFMWNTFVGMFVIDPTSAASVYLISLPMAVVVLQLPFVVLLLSAVLLIWRHENKIIVRHLQTEPAEIVSPEEIRGLVPARRRFMGQLGRFFTKGPGRWWHTQRLHRDLIALAFVKWHHHEDEETTWQADEDFDVLALRKRVMVRRAKLGS